MNQAEIQKLPKVELHVHLEGSVSPQLLAILAERNHLSLPEQIDLVQNKIIWRDLFDFFSVYDACSQVIQTPQDLTDVTYHYLEQAAHTNTLYVELTVCPQLASQKGMDYVTQRDAVISGIQQAEQEFGIEARIIMVLVRHYDHDECLQVVKNAIAHPSPYVVGIGLAGNEKDHGPEYFIEAFTLAQAHGLHRTTHAGEWYGPQSIYDSIQLLNVERIGHGLQTIYDPKLMQLVKDNNIHLELCLSSNLQCNAMASGIPAGHTQQPHPVNAFKDYGISLSLSTDDAPYFQTDLNQEYQLAHQQFGFSRDDLLKVTRQGILASFADENLKIKLLKKFNKEI